MWMDLRHTLVCEFAPPGSQRRAAGHRQIPPKDGGISVGQTAVVAQLDRNR